MTSAQVLPVILSGGSGTRLWPLSTAERPKQFIPLTGPETMLELTLARVGDRNVYAPPLIVASAAHAALVEEQLSASGATPLGLILEPVARNTAPAIALAALSADAPDQLLLVMPSDHLIKDAGAFDVAVRSAMPLARDRYLVTFGVRPSRPETAYGYILRGAELAPGIFAGERFAEKPDAQKAEVYLRDGRYDWNAGIFLFRADACLEALAAYSPDILAAAEAAIAAADRQGMQIRPDRSAFSRSPSISIDYAVMEKSDRVAVVPLEIDWSDVGSWDALQDVSRKDERGNAVTGDVLAIDASGCLLRSTGPKLVVIGVEDLVVIATGDAVLVVPREQSQRVKEAVDGLKDAVARV